MDISEVQKHFTAYGSGQLPEYELRNCIRSALCEDPELSPAFLALAEAYRRANLIDANLQLTINADIAEVTGPRLGLTMVRPARPGKPNVDWLADERAANSTDVDDSARVSGGAPASTGSTHGSAWESEEWLTEVAAPLYPGSVLRDRFVLVEELGRGGMGVVYKAYDRSRGDAKERYVAIKVLNEEFKRHPLAVRALQREARKAQKLAHPNVLTVFDFDRDGGNVYMVMEFLSGRSLDQVLRDDGRTGIPLVPAMEIVKSLGAALSYAHDQDIVHSDFKPSNAFLTRDGKVKVLDFGIARAAPSFAEKGERTLFDAGQLCAVAPSYASPEMLRGEEPDVRDDVYALACVTYELLTGYHPYQRIDALKAQQSGLQPRVIRKLSRGQWRILKQGLAFERAARCPTVDSLVSQLLARRSRVKVWVTAVAIGVTIGTLAAVLAWQWFGPRAALQQALRAAGPAEFSAALVDLRAAPNYLRALVLADSETQGVLIRHYQSEIQQAIAAPAYDYSRARALLDELKRLVPDSRAVAQLDHQLNVAYETHAREELARQDEEARALADSAVASPASPQSAPSVTPQAISTTDAPREAAEVAPQAPARDAQVNEEKRAEIEMLRETFEARAAAGDVTGASAAASALGRAFASSIYVKRDVPQILISSYVHLAKAQFAGGQVDAALKTLAEGRRKFGRSSELKDLEVRYDSAADIYDRLRSAVALNVPELQRSLEALRVSEGADYDSEAQMLAQTLADRIADQRAADRGTVADRLLDAGLKVFPDYSALLARGQPGKLPETPIVNTDE